VSSAQHIKIKGNAYPFDKNHLYWVKRTEKYSGYSTKIGNLIKFQKGNCAICGVPFCPTDVIEADHIIPRSKGGLNKYSNLQAFHKHCNIQKSRIDLSVSINEDFDVTQIL
jgi:RNA-directed DNA polymerase